MSDPPAVEPLLRFVAAWGLADAPEPAQVRPLDATVWNAFLGRVVSQRLTGHLVPALATGALPATADQYTAAVQAHLRAVHHVLLLEQRTLRLAHHFAEAGIEVRWLKGTAVSQLDYPQPSPRLFADVDVLVPSDRFGDAVSLLCATGYRRPWPEPRPGFDRRFGKSALLVDRDGYQVDLHRTFAMGFFGLRIVLDDLFASASAFTLGGRRLHGLGSEERFLNACYHAALGDVPPRLVPLRDVAQMLSADRLDRDRTLELARRWDGQAVLARAVTLAWDVLALDRPDPLLTWAREYRPGRRESHALASYVSVDHSYAAKAVAALPAIPQLRDKAAYLHTLLLPLPEFRAEHGLTRTRVWRRGGGSVVRALRRSR